jgi:hypothetical protein
MGLAPDVPDDFLHTIWTSRLPPQVQTIVAGQTKGSLNLTSHLADNLRSHQPGYYSEHFPATAELLERIEQLSRQVASLRASQTRSPSHSRNRRRSTPDYPSAPREIYWYHWNFWD